MCDIILAAGFARGLRLLSRPRIKRAQGKPDASRIRWPRTQKVEPYEHFSHHRSADIRLSLHDEPAAYADLSPVIVMPTVTARMSCDASSGSDDLVRPA